MSLEELWQIHQRDGLDAVLAAARASALDEFYVAILAFSDQDLAVASRQARRAAGRAPDDRLFHHAAIHLERIAGGDTRDVYGGGEAFAAFIRGGGNIPLYHEVSAALRAVHDSHDALDLLDIGVGDGRALLPALGDHVRRLHLLEPSAALLERTAAALAGRGITVDTTCATLQEFAATRTGRWQVIEATFSLHTISAAERPALLAWLRDHGERLLIAEFDAPRFATIAAPDQASYLVDRYQRGLAEYTGSDGDLVAQGFLVPILFSNFERSATRTLHEQPLQAWLGDLEAAGFSTIESRLLHRYWWADAYLIDAR